MMFDVKKQKTSHEYLPCQYKGLYIVKDNWAFLEVIAVMAVTESWEVREP